MKSSEIKKGRFYYLLHEYEGIWDSVRLCGDKLEDMSREKYILEKHLREMGEQIFALTDSDKEKLNIAHNLGFAGIKLGPLMAKFMKGERSNTENRETKSDEREIKFQELKDIFYCLFYEYKKIWRSSQVRGTPWVEQLREEYSDDFVVIVFSILSREGFQVTNEYMEKALESMDIAIQKSVREADINIRYSKTQVMAVLFEVNPNSINFIVQRILLDFYKLFDASPLDVSYKVLDIDGEYNTGIKVKESEE